MYTLDTASSRTDHPQRILLSLCLILVFCCGSSRAIDVGGPIEVDTVWSESDSPFNLVDDIRVSEGATLTIEPNVQVHLNHHAMASHWPGYTLGYLVANGVSFHGSSSLAENIFIRPTDNVQDCEFLGVRLVLNADGGILQNNYFSTDLYGIMAQGEWTIYNCEFENCAVGIWLQLNIPLIVSNCSFLGCDEGFHFFDYEGFPAIQIRYCNFYLPGHGIFVDGSPSTYFIDATQNYWGHVTGPTHPDNPGGEGVAIGDGVLFEPWLTEPASPVTGVQNDWPGAGIALHQNNPNPFNPVTTIGFNLPGVQHVKLLVYSVAGKPIATLVDALLEPGHHNVTWSGQDDSGHAVASGTYLYRLETGRQCMSRSMVLVR